MTEYLTVVDKKNRPLPKKLTRHRVHEQGLWHRTVHIWVLDSKSRLLLVKRGEWKSQDPGKWASYIGGHVLYGESFREAATRETKEEIGIGINKLSRFLPIILKSSTEAKEHTKVFLIKLSSNEKIVTSNKEFTDYKLIEPSLEDLKTITNDNLSGGINYLEYQTGKLSNYIN